MKKTNLLLCFVFLSLFQAYATSPWKETRKVIYSPPQGKSLYLLQPEQSINGQITIDSTDGPTRRFLRIVGGVRMPAPFISRGETNFRLSEFYIDDNLDSLVRKKDRYSLYFKGEDDNFERHACYRINGKYLTQGELTITVPVVRRQQLAVSDRGDFGVEVELFFHKPGRDGNDIYDRPDSLLRLPLPEGTGKYTEVSGAFVLPGNVACALLRIGGTRFSGECWVEAPRLLRNGKEVCAIPFRKHADRQDATDYWVGTNLATRSWPMWQLEFNGKTIFKGNIFDRASNVADFYIPLPSSLQSSGELKLTLKKEPHRAAFPYEVRSMEIIEQQARDFEIIAVPRYVTRKAAFGVLIETNRPDVTLRIEACGEASPAMQECHFDQPGLHVVEMRAGEAGAPIALTFSDGNRKEQACVAQVIDKQADNIYLSCGDDIYVDKQRGIYDYYFKWYMSNRVGNWYQFRPSYQWSGFRVADSDTIGRYLELLNQMQVPYAWQTEGRTLAGSRINLPANALASPMFRGLQDI